MATEAGISERVLREGLKRCGTSIDAMPANLRESVLAGFQGPNSEADAVMQAMVDELGFDKAVDRFVAHVGWLKASRSSQN